MRDVPFNSTHSTTTTTQSYDGEIELFTVYVPTNHIYVGDIFLLQRQDIIKNNLSVREGLGKRF